MTTERSKDFFVVACGKCGREGPSRDGDIESCVQLQHGMLVLQLCADCRRSTTVEEALNLLRSGTSPDRISLLDTITRLGGRVGRIELALRAMFRGIDRHEPATELGELDACLTAGKCAWEDNK